MRGVLFTTALIPVLLIFIIITILAIVADSLLSLSVFGPPNINRSLACINVALTEYKRRIQ
jgi:hypothetical protein